MTVNDLETLFDYGSWANGELLKVISKLTPEQFTQNVAGGHGSIRNTMVHMLSTEWGWLDRCGGVKRGAPLEASEYKTVASVVERWRQVERDVRAFLASLEEEDLGHTVEFAIGGGPKHGLLLGELMRHAANHGVHHRGQVALLLRSLGYAPGNVGMLFYYARSGG